MALGSDPKSFQEVTKRLNEIVDEVRDKDVPLEKSLDLYEEAIRLGNSALALVNKPEYSDEENMLLEQSVNAVAEDVAGDGIDAAPRRQPEDAAGQGGRPGPAAPAQPESAGEE